MDTMNIASQEDYRVNLEVFEGPLDLLLYLIKKNDLDVYDIPIAFVLEEYVKYIDSLQEMNIDLAGEFLLMAAELTLIKSRMLLPGEEGAADDDEEEGDPRSDLVRRLLEYQRFKEASDRLMRRPMVGRDEFVRTEKEEVEADPEMPLEASVYDLVNAFSAILQRVPRSEIHKVAIDRISVNERIFQLIEAIKKDVTVSLDELMPDPITRYDLVITFLAVLEMARLKVIRVYQGGVHDTIRIRGTLENVQEEDMMRLVQIEGGTKEA
jgi:segregation and condensation protein A